MTVFKKPLSGKCIVVTRPKDQAAEMTSLLDSFGAEVLSIPVLGFEEPTDKDLLDAALRALAKIDWIVFTSENAARYLSKGRAVAIDGRLEWREWEAQDGTKRQAVVIVADTVQFLGSRAAGEGEEDPGDYAIPEDLPVPAGVGAEDPAGPTDDEDIPF